MLQPNPFAPGFHPSLVIPFPGTGEAGIEQIMAAQGQKPINQSHYQADFSFHYK